MQLIRPPDRADRDIASRVRTEPLSGEIVVAVTTASQSRQKHT